MSETALLVLVLVPFLALTLVLGAVTIVALCRAKPGDVVAIVLAFLLAFARLLERLPRLPRSSVGGSASHLADNDRYQDEREGVR